MLLRCKKCNFVEEGTSRINESCSNCANSGESRETFPCLEAQFYSRMMKKYFEKANWDNREIIKKGMTLLSIKKEKVTELFDSLISDENEDIDEAIDKIKRNLPNCGEDVVFDVLYLTHKYTSSDEMKLFVVLCNSYIETLLYDFLYEYLILKKTQKDVRMALLDSIRNRDQFFKCFKTIFGLEFKKVVGEFKQGHDFLIKAEEVRKHRNKFVHKNPYSINKKVFDMAKDIFVLAPFIFLQLNNKYLLGEI